MESSPFPKVKLGVIKPSITLKSGMGLSLSLLVPHVHGGVHGRAWVLLLLYAKLS